PEYFNAVWVKNEWSRYLALIKTGAKKLLIPAYKDMDPYDLPEEFSHLQAQDMSKLGFMQDLIRGIGKIAHTEEPKPTVIKETVVSSTAANIAPLLRRVFMFLEDGEWNNAVEYCEKVLDIEPECAEAYLGKLMADLHVKVRSDLANRKEPFDNNKEYAKAIRFADDALRNELVGYIEHINTRNETARLDGIYNRALKVMNEAATAGEYESAAKQFASIKGYKNAEELVQKCYTLRMEHIYTRALKIMNKATGENAESAAHYYDCENEFKSAAAGFEAVKGYKDADEFAVKCYENAEISNKKAIIAGAKQVALGGNVTAYERAIRVLTPLSDFDGVAELIEEYENQIVIAKENEETQRRSNEYNRAVRCMSHNTLEGYNSAIESLKTLSGFRDADELLQTCYSKIEAIRIQEEADRAEKERKLEIARIERAKRKKRNKVIAAIVVPIVLLLIAAAIVYFTIVVPSQKYNDAMEMFESGNYTGASVAFQSLENYKDSATMVKECQYYNALDLIGEGKYNEALGIFGYLDSYSDSANKKVLVQALKDLNGEAFESTIKTILEANERVNIKYNLSGGTSATGDYITYLNASEYSLLTPEKLGYRFVEWKLNSFSYNKETSLEVVLDAVWSDDYIIKYNLDGGTADNPIDYHKDGDAVVIADPIREGYTFLGWTGTEIETPTKNLTIPAGSYGDREYTANWEAHGKITYNLDGGKAENKTVYTFLDESFTLNNPTRDGYTFIGWTGTGLTTPTMKVVVPKGSHGDREYTANWEAHGIISYNLNGGKANNKTSYTLLDDDFTLNNPTREGYTFVGWTGTGLSGLTMNVTILRGSTGNRSYTANWKGNNYTFTLNANGGTVNNNSLTANYGEAYTLPIPTRDYYIFLGWYTGDTKYSNNIWNTPSDITLTAKWAPTTYYITYELSGGQNSSQNVNSFTVESSKITLKSPTRKGYKFIGWYKDSAYKNKISEVSAGSHGNITCFAKWEIITYTISY
ncbi:MAG: InlB B-repeat-containing protein, partial [Clostridia bacterium]|nr:InlB B-repeat-containing protein [Clostridia bacterium]